MWYDLGLMKSLIFLLLFLVPCARAAETVTVYAYDSFSGKGGLGPWIAETLEKRHGIRTTFVSFASAGEALNQVAIEGKSTRADVVVGIDQSLLGRAREIGAFEKTAIPATIPEELRFDAEGRIAPFDYGYLTLVYDSRRTPPPKDVSLRGIARTKSLVKRIAVEDPRTSSIGLGFLLWTHALYRDKELDGFWSDFTDKIATLAPGWSGAYALFLKKEADLVVSYTTSPAYHVEKEKSDAIRGLVFPEGHYRQIEGAGLVARPVRKAAAARWLELLLSTEAQERVPTTQWMYPAAKNIALPKSFADLPPVKAVGLDVETIARSKREWVRRWEARFARP